MECKFCGARMDKALGICPECGLEIPREETGNKGKGWKIALAVIAGVLVLAVLAGFVLNTMGILDVETLFNNEQKENDVYYRDSYTVEDKTANAKANAVIATAGGKKLDNGTFQFYYAMNVMDYLNNYSYYLEALGLDYTQPLDAQYASEEDGLTWQQLFIDRALSDWYSYTVMNLMAEQDGYVVSEEMQSSIDSFDQQLLEVANENGFTDAQAMITSDFGAGYQVEDYYKYLEDRYKAVDYVSYLYEVLKPTAEEVEVYFAENEETLAESGITKDAGSYGTVRHILIQPEGGETDEEGYTVYSDEAWTACQTEAQGILDAWLAGEANEDSFAQLANEYSEDTGSNTTGGIYTEVTEGQMVDEFNDWLFYETHEYGDYGLIKTTYGYHIMFFVGLDEIWQVETENVMISEMIEEKAAAAEEVWPMEREYKKIVLCDLSLS